MNIGRNDPCPCGSGKKFKNCCLERAGLGALLDSESFTSLQEAQAFLDAYTQQQNQAPVDDFHGLSPDQMHRLLYTPFSSPDLVQFPEQLDTPPAAPIVTLFLMLVEAIGEDGLKPTAKGNLPRQFCREAAAAFREKGAYSGRMYYGSISSETDFFELRVTRLVAEMAGLVRKYKGKFILSRNCRNLLGKTGLPAIYPLLFRAYVESFNWAYWDAFPALPFIQQSFPFTLHLLNLYGDEWRPQAFYADCFIKAFPMVLGEVEPTPYSTPEQAVQSCYSYRALVHFAEFLGLAELESMEPNAPILRDFRLRKLPLLDDVVRFWLPKHPK